MNDGQLQQSSRASLGVEGVREPLVSLPDELIDLAVAIVRRFCSIGGQTSNLTENALAESGKSDRVKLSKKLPIGLSDSRDIMGFSI